jgi:nucleoside-diphosphate-sugar epimerase
MMSKNILLTGASGFVGQHLKQALLQKGFNVFDLSFDLLLIEEIKSSVNQVPQWDSVVHLAGLSSNNQVNENPTLAFDINVRGTYLLAAEVFLHSPGAHFIFPSTGYIYDPLNYSKPFVESSAVQPANYYSATKLYAEKLLQTLSENQKKRTTVLRLFNHTHKTQSGNFFLSYVYNEFLSKSRKNEKILLPIGNVNVERDFGCIQDLIAAF